ncbi:LysR family transcriptional regulator, partial [Roseomonas gilardii]
MNPFQADWTTLRILLATVELGSITQAAQRCGIATSAAAKRLQLLERDCSLPLLERSARGVRPTAAGEAMAQH